MTLTYNLGIDWNADTNYTNEAGRMQKFVIDRGKDRVIGNPGSGFEGTMPGRLIVNLDNYDGRYDPWNTGGALYGYLVPGKKVSFTVTDDVEGTFNLFTGIITDIQISGYKDVATLQVEDGANWLKARETSIALKTSTDAGGLISAILTDVAYPWTSTDLDTGADTIDYYWTSGRSALSEIDELAQSELGSFHIAANGAAVFKSRRASDSVKKIITEELIERDIYIPTPWSFMRSDVSVYVYPRVKVSSTDIWSLQDKPAVGASTDIELWAEYTYDGETCPAETVAVAGFTANSAADGGGSNMTTDFAVTLTAFSKTAKLVIANASTDSGYLTSLTLSGDAITTPDRITVKDSVTSSLPARFVLDSDWITTYNTAYDFTTVLTDYLSDAKPYPQISITNRPTYQFGVDLEDLITLQIPTIGIDDDYKISKISHTASGTCQEVKTTIYMYPQMYGINTLFLRLNSTDSGYLDTNTLGY